MQIYEALIEDHRKVQDLMNQLVNLSEDDESVRHDLVDQLHDELIPHSRAEEAVLYNSIRAVNTAQDLVWDGYEEHMLCEGLLRTLQVADKIDVKWKATVRKLQETLNHHIHEEETRIIPVAKHLFTDFEAEVMCEAFEDLKPQVKEGGLVKSTLDMIANMMPARLAAPLRSFTFRI